MTLPYFKELNLNPITDSIIILDIDGTLLADGEELLDKATAEKVKQLTGQRNMVYLCSNGFSSKKERNHGIARELGVTFYETEYKKPLKLAVLPLVTGATKQVIVIGDKFLTDGLLAINLDVPFVAVRSLRSNKEPLYSKLAYAVDAVAVRFLGPWARPPHYSDSLYLRTGPTPITVLTRPPLTVASLGSLLEETAKKFVKQILFAMTRKPRYLSVGGPQAVIKSLLAGLNELKVPHHYNPWQHQVTSVVGVIRGVETLRWAIAQKQKGFIRTIVAGPNIVVVPADENRLIMHPEIDTIVVPSPWNKDWWVSLDQSLERRVKPWAAGVDDNGAGRDSKGICLVYSKNVDEKVFNQIIESLWTHKLSIAVSSYGQFHQHEYFRLLKKTRMLVYLSNFESQGLALHEAWMADIPTLIWNKGELHYNEYQWRDPLLSAPYFDPQCGMMFTGEIDFESALIEFLEKYDTFTPRRYSLAHFTNAITARKYLDIVEQAQGK